MYCMWRWVIANPIKDILAQLLVPLVQNIAMMHSFHMEYGMKIRKKPWWIIVYYRHMLLVSMLPLLWYLSLLCLYVYTVLFCSSIVQFALAFFTTTHLFSICTTTTRQMRQQHFESLLWWGVVECDGIFFAEPIKQPWIQQCCLIRCITVVTHVQLGIIYC